MEHCCFVIHTPTFIIQYCSCHITALASLWLVVSVPPHHVLFPVVWFVAEGALNEGSPWQMSRKDSTRPNWYLGIKMPHAGGLPTGEEQPVGLVFCSLCVSPWGKHLSLCFFGEGAHALCVPLLLFHPTSSLLCAEISVAAKALSNQMGKKRSISLSFLALVLVGFLHQMGWDTVGKRGSIYLPASSPTPALLWLACAAYLTWTKVDTGSIHLNRVVQISSFKFESTLAFLKLAHSLLTKYCF